MSNGVYGFAKVHIVLNLLPFFFFLKSQQHYHKAELLALTAVGAAPAGSTVLSWCQAEPQSAHLLHPGEFSLHLFDLFLSSAVESSLALQSNKDVEIL